jgi:Tfp pilus assembly PilM family ATPase
VDASVTSHWRKHGERSLLRVHNFDTLGKSESPEALTAELKVLADSGDFSRHAWVTLWDVRSSHRYLRVPADQVKDAESIARQHGVSVLGLPAGDISVGVVEGTPPADPHQKVELSFFAAASEDIQTRLRPVLDAGFVVDGVCTPCGALWAQARLRRSSVPGAVHAYVALGGSFSAVVIVSNGFLLYGKEMHWGFAEAPNLSAVAAREDLADWLARELKQSFLYVKQYWEEDVSQALLCGDLPDIRSLTGPLIERLNIEVETLDSLDGIDTASLPEPADQFTDRVASMRLASAIAADPPPVNLLPVAIRSERAGHSGRVALVAGLAAAVAVGAFLYARAGVQPKDARRTAGTLQPQISRPELRVPEQPLPAQAPSTQRAQIASPAQGGATPPAEPQRQQVAAASQPFSRSAGEKDSRPVFRAPRVAAPEAGRPDPAVSAILYSSQQQSALVDGRIVRPGDRVGPDTVRSIEADAVVLVSDTGQVKRLAFKRSQVTAEKR